ncbi:porin [Arundinibacter roseus]|uniref:Porin n=2 Tax=Arundinibacter roseus TaxID=2070510 RepID=A0A4R4KDX0_9BACT|nr:porin [Arundinibacter roseus]
MDNLTDTTQYNKGLFSLYEKFNRLRFSGYIQPQYQVIESKGAPSFNGGNFPEAVNNRFMLRRGRLRLDYTHVNEEGLPTVFFVYQFDGTERGFFTRDFFGRIFENKWSVINLTAGIFPRPFGYEINLGSSDRESPERGRMSQLLMRTERDLGAMISFNPQRSEHSLSFLKIDLGFFNGQGLSGTTDFDSYKDLISRVSVKQLPISSNLILSAGASVLYGGMQQFTNEIYRMKGDRFELDDSAENVGNIAPRHYVGADMQLLIKNKLGSTELRAEYIAGTQTSTRTTTETPGTIPLRNGLPGPLYIRPFNGAYFYFLHSLKNPKHQFLVKYDWYDPNSAVAGKQLDQTFTGADVNFHTLGFGYNYYVSANLRLLLWVDRVKNEETLLEGFQKDLTDNQFTCRLQFRF